MTTRKTAVKLVPSRNMRGTRVKDEVYRQMFLLEERRPGAEMGLALALLRAWLIVPSNPQSDRDQEWLKKISKICIEMIEVALQPANTVHPCVQ